MFDFIKIREVPKTSWSSEETFNLKPRLKTLLALVVGLILFGLGEALLVASQIGVSPWTALAQGVANVSDLDLGLTTFLISVFVLFFLDSLKTKARHRYHSECNYYFPSLTLCYSFFACF